jgi:hypothetical protein
VVSSDGTGVGILGVGILIGGAGVGGLGGAYHSVSNAPSQRLKSK